MTEIRSLQKIDQLAGLHQVKQRIHDKIAAVQFTRKEKHQTDGSLHMVFMGNPGTGKSTIASLLSVAYFELGVLKSKKITCVSNADLVSPYVGGTATKTDAVINEAFDGILFVDEAYVLLDSTFGQEALHTILMQMETTRDRLVVIFAGYPEKMGNFLSSNPAISRHYFPPDNILHFPDYTCNELMQMVERMAVHENYSFTERGRATVEAYLQSRLQQDSLYFGNAHGARNLYMGIKKKRACRALTVSSIPSREKISPVPRLALFEAEDIPMIEN